MISWHDWEFNKLTWVDSDLFFVFFLISSFNNELVKRWALYFFFICFVLGNLILITLAKSLSGSKLYFEIFFFNFLSIKLSWSHDLGHVFTRLTQFFFKKNIFLFLLFLLTMGWLKCELYNFFQFFFLWENLILMNHVIGLASLSRLTPSIFYSIF
jgi:hypothetical protein